MNLFCRVGIDNPTIEVRFEHLNVEAEAYVGNRGVPTFFNFFYNKIMVRETAFSKKISIFINVKILFCLCFLVCV